MEAKTTRSEFCSDKCRVYWNREQRLGGSTKKEDATTNSTGTKKAEKDTSKISEALMAKFEAIKQQLKNKQDGKEVK